MVVGGKFSSGLNWMSTEINRPGINTFKGGGWGETWHETSNPTPPLLSGASCKRWNTCLTDALKKDDLKRIT